MVDIDKHFHRGVCGMAFGTGLLGIAVGTALFVVGDCKLPMASGTIMPFLSGIAMIAVAFALWED